MSDQLSPRIQSLGRTIRHWSGGRWFWPFALVMVCSILLHRGLYMPGTLNWGDWVWLSNDTIDSERKLPSVWDGLIDLGMTNASVNIGPIYLLMGLLGGLGVGAPLVERIMVFWPMVLLAPLSMYLLLGRFKLRPWARAGGAFLYAANSAIAVREIQHPYIVLGAACIPLMWAYVVDAVNLAGSNTLRGRALARTTALFSLSFGLAMVFDFRMAMLALLPALAMLGIRFVATRPSRGPIAFFTAVSLALTGVMQFYWILPVLFGGGGGLAGKLPDTPFANFYSFTNGLFLSDPFYTGHEPVWFSNHAAMAPLIALPLLAFGGLWVARRRTTIPVTVFALTACLGVFMVKGQNPPFGSSYDWAFSHVPGVQFFRDASKFAFWVAGSYAVLIAICLDRAANWWTGRENNGDILTTSDRQLSLFDDTPGLRSRQWEVQRFRYLAAVVVASFVIAALFGARASITNTLGGDTKGASIPSGFGQFAQDLDDDNGFGRILWFPSVSRWASFSKNHPTVAPEWAEPAAYSVSSVADVNAPPNVAYSMATLRNITDLLTISGSTYIALETDPDSEMWKYRGGTTDDRRGQIQRITAALRNNSDLDVVTYGSDLLVAKMKTAAPRFSAARTASPSDALSAAPLQWSQVSHSAYRMQSDPTPIIRMAEQFDKGWRASIRGMTADGKWVSLSAIHVPTDDRTNAWQITVPADVTKLDVKVGYAPQRWVLPGLLMSTVTALALLGILLRLRLTKNAPTQTVREVRTEIVDLNERTPVGV